MRVNFVLSEVSNNQITNTITQSFERCPNDISVYIFTPSQTQVILKPNIPVFDVVDVYAQPGIGIATDVASAGYILNAINLDTTILYVQDLEWLNTNVNYFAKCKEILNKIDIVVCRSQMHKTHIEKYMDKHVDGVMSDVDWNMIRTLVEQFRQAYDIQEMQHNNRLVR